jgi:hypothetical protein
MHWLVLIFTTPLFYILAPTCFGSSVPSSGSFLDPSELLEMQIELVVYRMCGYLTCVPDCRGNPANRSQGVVKISAHCWLFLLRLTMHGMNIKLVSFPIWRSYSDTRHSKLRNFCSISVRQLIVLLPNARYIFDTRLRDVLDKHFHIFTNIHIVIFVTSLSPCISKCKNRIKSYLDLGTWQPALSTCYRFAVKTHWLYGYPDTIQVKWTDCRLVGYASVQCGGSLQTFQRTPLSASSKPRLLTNLHAAPSALRMKTGSWWWSLTRKHSIAQQRILIKFWSIRQIKSFII